MALRKLNKDEDVLVIEKTTAPLEAGEMFTVFDFVGGCVGYKDANGKRHAVARCRVLAIGDKVVRGPDWDSHGGYGDWKPTCEGTVSHFEKSSQGNVASFGKWKPVVIWDDGQTRVHRMNANHQDLNPTGDSVDEEKKHHCLGKCDDCYKWANPKTGKTEPCPYVDECHKVFRNKHSSDECIDFEPIKEDNIMASNRTARKRELTETIIPQKKDAVEDAKLALAQDEDELKRLEAHATDHAETIADIKAVHKLDDKQAEAALRLSNKGVNIK